MTEEERTCFNCIHYSVCILAAQIDRFPPNILNIDGTDAPGMRVKLYTTLALCCTLFRKRATNEEMVKIRDELVSGLRALPRDPFGPEPDYQAVAHNFLKQIVDALMGKNG